MTSNLSEKHCIPCEGGTLPLPNDRVVELAEEVDGDWTIVENKELERTFVLKDFTEAISFINNVAKVAETEGHHPDISLHEYRKVTIRLSTHAIGGLSENDFILASKINDLKR